ncbi:hypothetical protein ACP4OV_005487 [Aristida adscensionis]
MYTTRPLSLLRRQPEASSRPPPEGNNSGYLIVKSAADDSEDMQQMSPWASSTRVWELPFRQNRVLKVTDGEDEEAALFVPVLDQPLASNRYYAVVANGHHKGLVGACSREDDVATDCLCRCIYDVEPRPFHPADVYQQIEVVQLRRGRFTARAVAADGIQRGFATVRASCRPLSNGDYWKVYESTSRRFNLRDAVGLDAALRLRQITDAAAVCPAATSTAAVVGRWYCPFFLLKEDGLVPRKQMDGGAFYEVALEQRWELHGAGVAKLGSVTALIGGRVEARRESRAPWDEDGYAWFRAAATGQRIGLCVSLWERMRWEEHNVEWEDKEEEEEVGEVAARWSVLVERFVVKRLHGPVAVAFHFVHLKKVRAR